MRDQGEHAWLKWLAIALVVASGVVLWPFVPWILLAIWASLLVRPVHARISTALGKRPRLGAIVTVVAFTLLLVPALVLFASLAVDAVALIQRAIESDRVQSVLQ